MPIINPFTIYWLGVVDTLKPILIIALSLSALTCLITSLATTIETGESLKLCKKWAKISFVAMLILIVADIFIPSKQTLIQMLVAQNITVDRVDVVKEVVERVYNDILNVVGNK